MSLDNISDEFAYEFFSQLKRFSEEQEENLKLKPEIREINRKEEVTLIRQLFRKKKPDIKKDIKNIPMINPNMQEIRGAEKQSAMEKIERLMDDSTIDMIECNGPGKEIIIKRENSTKKTNLRLSDEEIEGIFSIIEKQIFAAFFQCFYFTTCIRP